MKTIALILFALLFIVSCKNAIKDNAVSDKETPETNVEEIVEPVHSKVNDNTSVNSKEDLIGYWVGWFLPDEEEWDYDKNITAGEGFSWNRQNKITLSIDAFKNDSVYGHSIVAGNLRPFKGYYKSENDTLKFAMNEPGNNKYDGKFEFLIGKKDSTLIGKWNAYKKVETPSRKYSLTKKNFKYNPEGKIKERFVDWMKTKMGKGYDEMGDKVDMEAYFTTTEKVTKLNPSTVELTQEQVEKLTKADIYVLRNSIYAKHGYSFKKRQLRVFFDSHDWYMPVHVNIKSELTDIEKKNIKLLLRYEKYAEEYYDEFGRG